MAKIINYERLEDLAKYLGKPAMKLFLVEMMKLFLESGPKIFGDMHQFVANKNGEGLALSAHSFMSSCGTVGADRLIETLRRLEEAGKSKNFEEAQSLLEEIENDFLEANSELKKITNLYAE